MARRPNRVIWDLVSLNSENYFLLIFSTLMPPQPPHFGTRDRDKTETGHRVKPVTISSFSKICFFLQNCYGLLSISFDSVPPFQYRRGNVIGFAMNDIISIRAEIFKKTALLSLKLTSLSSSVGYSSFKIL